jgi:segregation and condensation protein B
MSLGGSVESLLFVAGEPLTIGELARALNCFELEAESALRELQLALAERGSGLQIVQIAGGFQLATRPEHAEAVARLLSRGPAKLSRAALETAAIIAYRQPVTQPEIEAVRGVGCGSVINTLAERGLIGEVGRKQTVGRPILYGTTRDFLHYFGIADLSELPPLDVPASAALSDAPPATSPNGASPLPAEPDSAAISAPAG